MSASYVKFQYLISDRRYHSAGIGAKMAKDVRVHHDGGEWAFEKILGDDEFMASGFLSIQPNGMKRIKNTKDNTYVSKCF